MVQLFSVTPVVLFQKNKQLILLAGYCTMPNRVTAVEECDARDDDTCLPGSNAADLKNNYQAERVK